jgi:hypothetical protein
MRNRHFRCFRGLRSRLPLLIKETITYHFSDSTFVLVLSGDSNLSSNAAVDEVTKIAHNNAVLRHLPTVC